jgi:hypothetical protein
MKASLKRWSDKKRWSRSILHPRSLIKHGRCCQPQIGETVCDPAMRTGGSTCSYDYRRISRKIRQQDFLKNHYMDLITLPCGNVATMNLIFSVAQT